MTKTRGLTKEPSVRGLFSMHGGHTGTCCAHAEDTLEAVVRRAVELGLTHYAVTEHAPKSRLRDRDEDEVARGDTPEGLHAAVVHLCVEEFPAVRERFSGEIDLLLGLETDALPEPGFVDRMRELRSALGVELLVGSVHHVREIPIDAEEVDFRRAIAACGDAEAVELAYYDLQATLLDELRPEIVAHFDLVRRAGSPGLESEAVRRAVRDNLQRVADYDLLLEINASPVRGEGAEPFPGLEVLRLARSQGVRVTLGDDSHGVHEVADGLAGCRSAAVEAGYGALHHLAHAADGALRVDRLEL